jgi:CRISPR system Cascade subunit CasB
MTSSPNSFIHKLYALNAEGKEDRAALAALRRGLGRAPGEAAEMIPFLARMLPPHLPPEIETEAPYYLVASLFALHPTPKGGEKQEGENLGRSLKRLPEHLRSESLEKRFQALLSSRPEQLPDRLRQVISLLRSQKIPVDYQILLSDLLSWTREGRPVQRRWARSFWGSPDAYHPSKTESSSTSENGK